MKGSNNVPVDLTLCIPTNGVCDWVKPVLESIFSQNVADNEFEVVVTDNGDNKDFHAMMDRWCKLHTNIRYRKTKAKGFINQIESFKDAHGTYIKFVNHRMPLRPNALKSMLDFVKENKENKPICFFLNGELKLPPKNVYDDFDSFVRNLSYYSSWSGGLGIWKSDFAELPNDLQYNELFPHTTILFRYYDNRKYIIDNRIFMDSLPENHPKGRYNLFYAFGVEYPGIIMDLLRKKCITIGTFTSIKKGLCDFIADLYIDFLIRKKKCSYELRDYNKYIDVYYSTNQIFVATIKRILIRVLHKVTRTF